MASDALGRKPRHLYRSNETVFTIIQQWNNVGNDRGRERERESRNGPRLRLARKPREEGEKPGHGEGLLLSSPLLSLSPPRLSAPES